MDHVLAQQPGEELASTKEPGHSGVLFVEVDDAPPTAACWKCRGAHATPQSSCKVCRGSGVVPRSKPKSKRSRAAKLFPDYEPPGPLPLAPDAPDLRVGIDEDLSFLVGHWKIFQNKSQHRYSTDDVVTAWVAYRMGSLVADAKATAAAVSGLNFDSAAALKTVDIGCGIGSVVLMTSWLFPGAQCVGIEAQPTRISQAMRSVAFNGVSSRVTLIQGDLRDPSIVPSQSFDIVTGPHECTLITLQMLTAHSAPHPNLLPHAGTPPYFDVNVGITPDDAESARCLFEYRGGIEAYCMAAARLMSRPHGVFVVVETAQAVERSYSAAALAGLKILARIDFVPREGKPVLINVFVMAHAESEAYYATSTEEAPETAAIPMQRVSRLIPGLFAPHGQSPYDKSAPAPCLITEGSGSLSTYKDAISTSSAVKHEAVVFAGASSSSSTLAGEEVPSLAEGSREAVSVPAAKRKRPQIQRGKQMPAARPGELVVTISVRDLGGERTRPYKLLLQELGKPG